MNAQPTDFLNEIKMLLDSDGSEGVVLGSQEAENRYGASTIGVKRRMAGAILPFSRENDEDGSDFRKDIVAIIDAARRYCVPLFPISTGNNWGYGSANPVVDDCVILDLSRMTRIWGPDPETGVVDVQPGVTQRMLRKHLDTHGLRFLCPVSGAGPDCSLVGNALERGYGITPHADHFISIMSFETVLPNGQVYRPPLAELGADEVDRAFKWGAGPFIDGIFTQSAFGVTTRMSIALAPIPERMEAFFFAVPEHELVGEAVEAVRDILREVGGVLGSINLMNTHRVLSMMVPYPRDHIGSDGLIDPSHLAALAKTNQVMPWMGAGAMYGNARVLRAVRPLIRKRLRGTVKRLMFFTPGQVSFFARLARYLPGSLGSTAQNVFGTLNKTMQLLAGAPSEIALPLAYWVSGQAPHDGSPMNPAKDGCGLLWYSPLVPMRANAVKSYADMVESVCKPYAIEPLITLTSVSDRCFDSTVPILFDRNSEKALENARSCYLALLAAGKKEGFVPYRAPVNAMGHLMKADAPYWQIVRALKQALDPAGIMAPGRYDPTVQSMDLGQ